MAATPTASRAARVPQLSRVCLLLAMAFAAPAHAGATLYSYGTLAGDAAVSRCDDCFQLVSLAGAGPAGTTVKLPFYSFQYTDFYINNNGAVSFGNGVSNYSPAPFPSDIAVEVVAPLWSDVDTRTSGKVWYRTVTDGAFLKTLSTDIKTNSLAVKSFNPTVAQVVTWDKVPAYDGKGGVGKEVNTFQAVIATDGVQTFTIFKYPDGGIQWLIGSASAPGAYPIAGFQTKTGNVTSYMNAPGSGTASIADLPNFSNTLPASPGTLQYELSFDFTALDSANGTWSAANGTGVWGVNGNWGGQTPGRLGTAIFGGTAGTVTLADSPRVQQMAVNTSGYRFTSALAGVNDPAPYLQLNKLTTASADTTVTFGGKLVVMARQDDNGFGALTMGRLTFTDNSVLVGHYAHSIDGASLRLKKNAQLQIYTLNASTRNSTLVFDISEGGTGGTLDLRGLDTVLGGISSVGAGAGVIKNSLATAAGLTVDFDDAALAYSGVIQNNLRLTKAGSGTLTLSGANSYTGGTTLAGGTLGLGSAGAIGGAGAIVFNGGTLQFGAANATDYSSRFSTAANQAYKLDTNGRNVTLATALTSSGGALTKYGAGTLTLGGANTYGGATSIMGGTLALGRANALSAATALTVAGGARFNMNGFAQTVSGLTGAGNVSLGAARLTVNGGGVFSGAIDGAGGLTKGGDGKLTLSGINTYSGATNVDAGELNINGSALNSAFNVARGATLSGSGAIGALTLAGTLAPGNSPGMLTTGDTTFAGGSTYLWEINDANGAAGVGYDFLQVNGVLSFTGGDSPIVISIRSLMADNGAGDVYNFQGWQSQGYSFTLASATGGITGYADNLFLLDTSGFSNALHGGKWTLGMSGNQLSLNFAPVPMPVPAPVPEPESYAMLLAGLALMGGVARRRRQRA